MSVEFDRASDESVVVADDASLTFASGGSDTPVSFVFRINPSALDNATDYFLTAKRSDAGQKEYYIRLNGTNDTIQATFVDDSANATIIALSNASAVIVGVWSLVCINYNGGGAKEDIAIYVDAIDVTGSYSENNVYTSMEDTDADLVISGRYEGAGLTNFYDGEIEDYRARNRLTSIEEMSLLTAGYRGPLGGEVIWLSMTEARGVSGGFEGASLANGTNLLPDLSVNSNDGDPVNTPTGRASKAPRYGVAV